MSSQDNLESAKKDVEEIVDVMATNLRDLHNREEETETLLTKSEELEKGSKIFKNNSEVVKEQNKGKNNKMRLIIIYSALAVIVISLIIVCFIKYIEQFCVRWKSI